MRNFDDYKFICFTQGMNPELIENCREFVIDKHRYLWQTETREFAEDDLGYAELTEIVNFNDSLKKIIDAIKMSTLDFDSRGRNISKMRMKQLIKKPGKHINRLVLKSYYLFYFGIGDKNA